MNTFKLFILLIILNSINLKGQNDYDSSFHRHYDIGISPSLELNNVSINSLSVFKIGQDLYTKGIQPKIPNKVGNLIGGIWSFSFTYLSLIWTHEFGHSLRAKQVNGTFKIHNASLPIPYTTMHLPENVSFQDQALSVIGGFEENYLTSRKIQDDFYEFNGLYNDELSLAFVHKMMYPIYVSLVIPQDPNKKETWIKTAGDPVHYIMPVWQNFSENQIFMGDSSVNKGLVNFYNQSAIFATFLNLFDPAFYKQISASFGKVTEGKRPKYLAGNNKFKWTYGTMFNTSILGYELYLNNYIKLEDKLIILRIKHGRPFKNNSINITSPNIYRIKKVKIGFETEAWDQDIFGKGFMFNSDLKFSINKNIDFNFQLGYKTKGYSIGKSINEKFFGWFGFRYYII